MDLPELVKGHPPGSISLAYVTREEEVKGPEEPGFHRNGTEPAASSGVTNGLPPWLTAAEPGRSGLPASVCYVLREREGSPRGQILGRKVSSTWL